MKLVSLGSSSSWEDVLILLKSQWYGGVLLHAFKSLDMLHQLMRNVYMLQASTVETHRQKRSHWRDSDPSGPNDTSKSILANQEQ